MKTDLHKKTEHTGTPRPKLDEKARRESGKDNANPYCVPPRRWLFTFMYMNTSTVEWVYLVCLAFGKEENQLRDLAKAYLIYKLVFLAATLIILGALAYIELDLVDKLLIHMEML